MSQCIVQVNLATPKVNTARGATPAPVSLASSQALVEAETKLARAKVEVLKLRKQMQMFNYFKSGAEPRDIWRVLIGLNEVIFKCCKQDFWQIILVKFMLF